MNQLSLDYIWNESLLSGGIFLILQDILKKI